METIRAAASRLRGVVRTTPVLTSNRADAEVGAQVFFKMESFQKGGSFKIRGAYNAISQLSSAKRKAGVVAYSSGNHAQAVAIAAAMLDVAATVVMPSDAPPAKLSATRAYGARIVSYDRQVGDREAIAREIMEQTGASLIPPYDHPDVIAGQGTLAVELIEEVGPLDYLYVPVGGGGLIAGCALACAALAPACRVVGVEPEAGDDVRRSFERGAIVSIPTPMTIADGAQTCRVGDIPFPIIRSHVHRVTTVSDDALRAQMLFFLERMKVVVEATGCLGAAAAFKERPQAARVGVVVSGGNVSVRLAQAPSGGGGPVHLAIS